MQLNPDELGETLLEVDEINSISFESQVLLFNDEIHTFEEVINQIIKAINCSQSKAETLTLQVHNQGKAVVYRGELVESIRISNVLEEIGLITRIEC
ncbi:MAG: ATP-dependent Clp protease adaptor ClpS [Bacteroidetes bacterium]|nr:ATP-dependent Clp protease adaptor ClpS [Bacteroidota bacterium]